MKNNIRYLLPESSGNEVSLRPRKYFGGSNLVSNSKIAMFLCPECFRDRDRELATTDVIGTNNIYGWMRVIGNNGVSLVEVLIALVVLLLVFIGLLQAALLGIDHNMRNLLREEAINIVSQKAEEARSLPFDHVKSNPGVCSITNNICSVNEDCTIGETCNTPPTATISSCSDPNYPMLIQRNFRNMQKDFGSRITVTDIDADTKEINVLVRWEHKDECYTQSATTLRRR